MSNLEVVVPFADGSACYLHEKGEPLKYAVETLFTDDFGAPPKGIILAVETESGKKIKVKIPYSIDEKATVFINEKEV
uniref:hypothetical protein n=1 Tax=Candidatus Electrothrix sp. TaxID=2170559 RepID=UPI0040566881